VQFFPTKVPINSCGDCIREIKRSRADRDEMLTKDDGGDPTSLGMRDYKHGTIAPPGKRVDRDRI
jgi:hypothetical protein